MSRDAADSDHFTASFSIQSPKLDFEALANAIGIKPTHSHRVGDLDFMKKPFEHDQWLLRSPLSREEALDEHLKWLAHELEPYYDYLKLLKGQPDIYFCIYCGYTSDKEQCGFSLSPAALSIFVELDITLELHVLAI